MNGYLVKGEGLPEGGVLVDADEQGFTILASADSIELLLEAWVQEDDRRQWSQVEDTFVVVQANSHGGIVKLEFWSEYENGEYDLRNSPFEWTAVETGTSVFTFDERRPDQAGKIHYLDLNNMSSPFEIRVNGETVYQRGIDF